MKHTVLVTLSGSRALGENTLARLRTKKSKFFDYSLLLKWDDTVALSQVNGNGSRIGRSERSKKWQMQKMIDSFYESEFDLFINAEDGLDNETKDLLIANKKLNLCLSGVNLKEEQVREALIWSEENNKKIILALESEQALVWFKSFLNKEDLKNVIALIVGSSYLSENAFIYESLGLERYRNILRALVRQMSKYDIEVISTSSYCTFEGLGRGDKSREFVISQIDYMLGLKSKNIGFITKFFWHIDFSIRHLEQLELLGKIDE